jgi:hypothetical protein
MTSLLIVSDEPRNASGAEFAREKIRHVLPDLACDFVGFVETADLVIEIRFHHAGYFGRINLHGFGADAIGRMINRNVGARRRVLRLIEIVESA